MNGSRGTVEKGSSNLRRLAVRLPMVAVVVSVTLGGVALTDPAPANAVPPAENTAPGGGDPDWRRHKLKFTFDSSGKIQHVYLDGKPIDWTNPRTAETLYEILDGRELKDLRWDDRAVARTFRPSSDPEPDEPVKSWQQTMDEKRKRLNDVSTALKKVTVPLASRIKKTGDIVIEAASTTRTVLGQAVHPPANVTAIQDPTLPIAFTVWAAGEGLQRLVDRSSTKAERGVVDRKTRRDAKRAPAETVKAWDLERESKQAQRDAAMKSHVDYDHPDAKAARARAKEARVAAKKAQVCAEGCQKAFVRQAVAGTQKKIYGKKQERAELERRGAAARARLEGAGADPDALAAAKQEVRGIERKMATNKQELKRLEKEKKAGTKAAKKDLFRQARALRQRPEDPPEARARAGDPGPRTPGGTGAARDTGTRNPQGKRAAGTPEGKRGAPAAKSGVASNLNGRHVTARQAGKVTPRLPRAGGSWPNAGAAGQGVYPGFEMHEAQVDPYLPLAIALAEDLYEVEVSGTEKNKRILDERIKNYHLTDPDRRATFQKALKRVYRPQIVEDGNGGVVLDVHPIRKKWMAYIGETYGKKTDPDQARYAQIADKKATSKRMTVERDRDRVRDVLAADKRVTSAKAATEQSRKRDTTAAGKKTASKSVDTKKTGKKS